MLKLFVSQDGNVGIELYERLGVKRTIHFSREKINDTAIAYLVRDKIQEDLERFISEVRRQAYNEGRKDTRRRQKIKKTFFGLLKHTDECGF